MKLINRDHLLNQLKAMRNTPDIKIITGIRRSGKSKLLLAYMDWIKQEDSGANIIFIDLRLLKNERLKDYHKLNSYIERRYKASVDNYLCIDEVQLCEQFELTINSLHASEKYDIYLTGSNAFMLSSDLATLFTGRHIEMQVFPFSFSEYRQYFGEDEIQTQFDQYVIAGGLSGSYLYSEEEQKTAYINEVYSTILRRDLMEKYNLSDSEVLPHLAEYMMDNIGNISSPNSIANILSNTYIGTNNHTISDYMKYLCRAFVFYKVDRYDLHGKKYLQSLSKYYLADVGIRFSTLGMRNMDFGRVYENLVALELLRRGYRIYVGKLYQKEIDFVAMKQSEKIYIQVAGDITNEETFKREYTPLLQIKDAYPKWIIARTRLPKHDYLGIGIYDIATWLVDY